MRLVVSESAERQIREAANWWVENRSDARSLLREDLARAFELISQFPEIGPVAQNVASQGIRRVLLRRTNYHLYYHAAPESVAVLALWHTSHGSEPEIQ